MRRVSAQPAGLRGRGLEGPEGHAGGELPQDLGVEGVRLAAGEEGLGEVVGGPGVGHHHLDVGASDQRQREGAVVDTGGLQHHARGPLPSDDLGELGVVAGGVGERANPLAEGDDEFCRADVNANGLRLRSRGHGHLRLH